MTPESRIAEQQPAHYDAFAAAYARENENGLANRWYARPAVLDLLGDIAGRHVLDAGCGSGPLLTDLEVRGARVAGFDASPAMIRLARERLGDEADLQVADLTHRSLSAMSESFTAAGFRISAVSEPPVSPDTPPGLLPSSASEPTRFLGFIFFALEAVS